MKLGLEAGAEARFSKTLTERDFLLTAEVTGDHDPLHVDAAYAAKTAFGQRIAHGALVLGLLSSTASTIAHRAIAGGAQGVPVSLGYERVRFLAPAFIGDTLEAIYRVDSLDPARGRSEAACEVRKADGTLCLAARHLMKWVG